MMKALLVAAVAGLAAANGPVCYSQLRSVRITQDASADNVGVAEVVLLDSSNRAITHTSVSAGDSVSVVQNAGNSANAVDRLLTTSWTPGLPTGVNNMLTVGFSTTGVQASGIRVTLSNTGAFKSNLLLFTNDLFCGSTPPHARARITPYNVTTSPTVTWQFGASRLVKSVSLIREMEMNFPTVAVNGFPVGTTTAISNVALTAKGATATSNSELVVVPSKYYGPLAAIDNAPATLFVSAVGFPSPSMEVVLPSLHSVRDVVIFSRSDCCSGRAHGAKVEVLADGGSIIATYFLTPDSMTVTGVVTACAGTGSLEIESAGYWSIDTTVTCPSASPSVFPTVSPTATVTRTTSRSATPSASPSSSGSKSPSTSPSQSPSVSPSASPSASPSESPSASPSASPSPSGSGSASPSPSLSTTSTQSAPPSAAPLCFPTIRGRYVRYVRDNRKSAFAFDELQVWSGSTNMARAVKGVTVTATNVEGNDVALNGAANVVDGVINRPMVSKPKLWLPGTNVKQGAVLTLTFPSAVTVDALSIIPRYIKEAAVNPFARNFEVVLNEGACSSTVARTTLSYANSSAVYNWRLDRPLRVKTVTLRRTPAVQLASIEAWGTPSQDVAVYSNYARAAAGARAYTSSVYIDRSRPEVNYGGANLLDASRRTIWHSSFTDLEPSATVDLGREVFLTSVMARSRQDCCPGRAMGGLLQVLDSRRMVVWSQVMTGNNIKVTGRADGCLVGQVEEYAGDWNFKLPMECVSRSPTVSPTASPSPSPSSSVSVSPSVSPSANPVVLPNRASGFAFYFLDVLNAAARTGSLPVNDSEACGALLASRRSEGWTYAMHSYLNAGCTLYMFNAPPGVVSNPNADVWSYGAN